MSNYDFLVTRRRRQSLFIVEGNHEKNKLIYLLLKIFPEIDIREEDIIIYETNVYMLYDEIVKEYEEDWDTLDIDLPYIVSKKKQLEQTLYKADFNNIVLIFDYERQDPKFSEEKITRLQQYFVDSTDVGKLYINYPMVESYQDFSEWPDSEYKNKLISVDLQLGEKYKRQVKGSLVYNLVGLPSKMRDILEDRFKIADQKANEQCVMEVLGITSDKEIEKTIEEILEPVLTGKELSTAANQFAAMLNRFEFIGQKKSYWQYMRKLFSAIIRQCICKAHMVSGNTYEILDDDIEKVFWDLELLNVLEKQNICSRDEQNGYIWILNTSIFFVPDYKFGLIL